MAKATRIGIVTTGHGPRDEYVHYHGEFLRRLGSNVEIAIRHIYDGLSLEQITPHQVGKETANIGAHVHVPGAVGNHMGDGWEHRFYALDFAVEQMQRAVTALEREDNVDLIVLACAAEIPADRLKATTLMIHPRELIFSLAGDLVHGAPGKLRFGVLVDAEHAEHDRADWARRPWFDRVELVMAPVAGDTLAAAGALGKANVDYAFYFGYGIGLAPFDPIGEVQRLEAAVAAPLLLPHRVTCLFLRNIVGPSIDDLTYLPKGWGASGGQASNRVSK
jgi:hypothetical protein